MMDENEINNYYFSLLTRCKRYARIDYNTLDSYIFDEDDMWDIIFSELLEEFDDE
jgi:hypothetical protein